MGFRLDAPLDGQGNELQNVLAEILGSDPGSPAESRVWYNTTDDTLRFRGAAATLKLGRLDQLNAPTADVSLNSNKLTNVATPSASGDAATQGWTLGLKVTDLTAPTADFSMNSHKITSLTDGSSANDAVNKGQLDGAISALAAGMSWKDNVRAASTSNVTLASAVENGDSFGGVTLATGDRVGLFGQTAGAENGIYTVNASGAPTRATDADSAADLQGSFVTVDEGTNASKIYFLATDNITLGTTALVWTEFTGSTYSDGAGLTLTGTTFAVGAGTGITVNADDVAIDPAVVVRKFAADIGDNSSTTIDVPHNLGTRDITFSVYDKSSPWQAVHPDPRHLDTNTLRLIFTTAPTTDQFRCVVHA